MAKDGIDAVAENGGETRCFVCCHGKVEGKLSVDISTGSVEWRSAHGETIRAISDNVLAVRLASREATGFWAYVPSWFTSGENGRGEAVQDVLVLSVVEHRGAKRRICDHKLVFSSADECSKCCQCVESLLSHLNRPKSLIVFVNPYGGQKRGRQVYEQEVAPVFAVAGIRTNVVVTQRSNEARDFLKDKANDLSVYDGVVVVGGDGTFAELQC